MRVRVGFAIAAVVLLLAGVPGQAQFHGQGPDVPFKDTSMLKPPAGHKVALIVFEDLGCPGCAMAHPYELKAVEQTGVSLVRYDFPLAAHIWTFQGAVYARYIQDKISPELATQYRTDVFAAQRMIANKDDLERFTRTWMTRHGKQMPFVVDADGSLAKKVQADYDLGRKMNLQYTPTVVVATKDKYQVVCGVKDHMDPAQILPTIEGAIAQAHGK
jgi:protein-disulfide isomerase